MIWKERFKPGLISIRLPFSTVTRTDSFSGGFCSACGEVGVFGETYGNYVKWLRFYLDFCEKYQHPPRDRESLQPFLRKLASKNQSRDCQEEAAASVGVLYSLVEAREKSRQAGEVEAQPEDAWEHILIRLKEEVRLRQYSDKTLKTYLSWISQFGAFLDFKEPETVDSGDAKRFLTHLAVDRGVAASTQNQAFNALLFLYRHILQSEYELGNEVVRAKRTKYIPVVLSREEIDRIVKSLPYPHNLMIQLMYGCGLRMFECLNLRVHCLNLEEGLLTIHDGKGVKDRTLPLPKVLIPLLREHLQRVEVLHRKDLAEGYSGVFMPKALDRKWRNAAREIGWQWLFPAKTLTFVPESGEMRRYHQHETHLQKSLRMAVKKAGIQKRVTSHIFRHSFASHLLQANYDIRTIQEMLGHSDVRTTMIYTHTVKSRTLKERTSPLDFGLAQKETVKEKTSRRKQKAGVRKTTDRKSVKRSSAPKKKAFAKAPFREILQSELDEAANRRFSGAEIKADGAG
jgi:integron integrase